MANGASTLARPSGAQLRRELVDLVAKDLLGPAGGEAELLPRGEQPRDRYMLGLLAPRGRQVEPEADEPMPAAGEGGEEAPPEEEPAQASLFPSSIGMSFHADGDCERLRRLLLGRRLLPVLAGCGHRLVGLGLDLAPTRGEQAKQVAVAGLLAAK